MIYLGILLGIGIMAAMIYLAFDKKTSSAMKKACLIALGIMVLTVIVCLFLIFTDTRVPVDPSRLIVGEPPAVKETGSNTMVLLLLVIFLIAIFTVIVYLAIREDKKNLKGHQNVASLW